MICHNSFSLLLHIRNFTGKRRLNYSIYSVLSYWSQPTLKPFRRAYVEAGLIFGAWAWTATSFVAVVAALDHCLNVTYVQSAPLCDIDMLWVRGHPKNTLKGESLIIDGISLHFLLWYKKDCLPRSVFGFWGQVDFFLNFGSVLPRNCPIRSACVLLCPTWK